MIRLSIKKNGMSLVEVVISSAIILLLSSVLISTNFTYLKTSNVSLKTVKAAYLIEEGVEAVNFIKNSNWSSIGNVGTNYYLVWLNGKWVATTTENYVDSIYERSFFTENTYRDSNDDIVTNGGTIDTNTRKLTVQILWSDSFGTTSKSLSTYIMK